MRDAGLLGGCPVEAGPFPPPRPQVHTWPHPCVSRAGALAVMGQERRPGELTAPDKLDFSQAITAPPVLLSKALFL